MYCLYLKVEHFPCNQMVPAAFHRIHTSHTHALSLCARAVQCCLLHTFAVCELRSGAHDNTVRLQAVVRNASVPHIIA